MKLIFLAVLCMDAAPENKGGGFTPEEKSELKTALQDVQTALETKQKALVEGELKKHADTINESLVKFTDWQTKKDETDLKNQEALTEVLMKVKDMQTSSNSSRVEAKSLQSAMIEALADPENIKGIASVSRGHRFKMALKGPIDLSARPEEYFDSNMHHRMDGQKTVGNMTGAGNLTGQGFVNYNQRNVILPAQKTNARDLVPTVRSETGTYVTFRESAGEGSISRQTTHGAAKTQIDFDFARVEIVSEYIAGFTRFAKQLMRQIPFLQNTLPRLLLREFYKVENRRFYDVMATAYAAGGLTAVSAETEDIYQMMDWITQLYDADYIASYGLLRYTALNRINKFMLDNGNYPGSGGVTSSPDGSIRINGTPVIPVTWIPSFDKFLTFDNDYVERVEVESLAIEFFEQDDDNVQKNLITARIECLEDFAPLQPASILIGDFGNSSSS